jgi:hypothetical protein
MEDGDEKENERKNLFKDYTAYADNDDNRTLPVVIGTSSLVFSKLDELSESSFELVIENGSSQVFK